MTLDRALRAAVREQYPPIPEHFARKLRARGRGDILERRREAIALAADDVGPRGRLHDRVIAAIDDEATGVIREDERDREKSARPYPTISRGAA